MLLSKNNHRGVRIVLSEVYLASISQHECVSYSFIVVEFIEGVDTSCGPVDHRKLPDRS